MATEKTTTIIVSRIVSEKVGQLTLVNSCLASCQKAITLLNINTYSIPYPLSCQNELTTIGYLC